MPYYTMLSSGFMIFFSFRKFALPSAFYFDMLRTLLSGSVRSCGGDNAVSVPVVFLLDARSSRRSARQAQGSPTSAITTCYVLHSWLGWAVFELAGSSDVNKDFSPRTRTRTRTRTCVPRTRTRTKTTTLTGSDRPLDPGLRAPEPLMRARGGILDGAGTISSLKKVKGVKIPTLLLSAFHVWPRH